MSGTGRKLAAIMSADVAGYSRLVGADEEGTIATLRDYRESIINPILDRYGGRIANTAGDSLLIEFGSAVDAMRCAIELQDEIAKRGADLPNDRRIAFRIGINIGDVVVQGEDLLGDGVNVAARLQSTAQPGDICISASVHDQIVGKLAVDLIDLGQLELKNIERPIRAYALAGTSKKPSNDQQTSTQSPDDAPMRFDLSRFKRLSIVVMPFKDLGGAGNASLAEGLRLSLHALFIKLPGLFLLHTGTVEKYRGQRYSAVDVGHEVDARYIVGGAVQCAGERVRVIVEVIDASAQEMVWGETYDRVLNDIFDLQDEIAREIVDALDVELRAGDVGRLRSKTISDLSARKYLHRGMSHLYQGDRESTLNARRMLEKIEQIEPDVPLCLGMIALTYWREARYGWSDDPQESMELAERYASRTIELGDPEGFGHTIMGSVQLSRHLYDEAKALSLEAISRRPSCPLANGMLAETMRYSGNPDQAIIRMREAMKLAGTFPPWMIDNVAASLRDNGQVKASVATASEAAQLFPDNVEVLVTLCSDYAYSSMPKEAEAVAKKILAAEPGFSIAHYTQSQPYRDRAVVDRIVESLRSAGLPD